MEGNYFDNDGERNSGVSDLQQWVIALADIDESIHEVRDKQSI
jgi:hypothetical protein